MATDWHLVLSRDGTVLDSDGAPRSWVGTRLVDRDDVPDNVKQAGHDALRRTSDQRPSSHAEPAASASLPPHVHLAVVDAVPLRRVPTDVRDLLRSSLAVLKRQADAVDVTLTVRTEDDVPRSVSVDRAKIAWAVTALVGNALRYVRRGSQTMPGGSITVQTTYDAAAGRIAIEIQDDGPGIPADKLPSLLRGDSASPGTALGLTMVRDVVAAHGGTLTVASETGGLSRGTTIRFTLPVA